MRLPSRLREFAWNPKLAGTLLVMGKREKQQVAYAVLELEDARDELVARGEGAAPTVRRLEDVVARLDSNGLATPGLPVSEAARYLEVSEPTVRDWLKRGVLKRVSGSRPVLIDRSSLRHVHRLLAELRERGKDRDWLRSLMDYLDDLAVVRSPEVQRGLADFEAGRFEPA
jgi:excisionase family DNA binding protein